MRKWEEFDAFSGITFCLEETESSALRLNCTFNRIKVDIRHYDFNADGLAKLKALINRVHKEYK